MAKMKKTPWSRDQQRLCVQGFFYFGKLASAQTKKTRYCTVRYSSRLVHYPWPGTSTVQGTIERTVLIEEEGK